MISKELQEMLNSLEYEKDDIVKQINEIKKSPHVCFITYHKLKKRKKKINAEIKKIKENSLPDIIA